MRLERGLSALEAKQANALAKVLEVSPENFLISGPVAGEGYVTSTKSVENQVIHRQEPTSRNTKPVLDLFCGVGGFSSGFEATGEFEIVAGTDLLGDRLKTFCANHSSANGYGGDIRGLNVGNLLSDCPKPFVVIGGPPCQGFSSIRPFRNIEWADPRNNLGEEFCRIIAETEPEWLVFENVVGLVTHKKGRTFAALLDAFEALGYRVSAKIMNAAYHGLPQRRERLLIVGSKNGKPFEWPTATHRHNCRSMAGRDELLISPNVGLFDDTVPALTLMDAINDLPELRSGESAFGYASAPENAFQRTMRAKAHELTLHSATNHSEQMLEIIRHAGSSIASLPPGMVSSGFSTSYSRLAADEPSNTITVNFVHPASNRCIHPYQDRALTPREGARLQSFPDHFIFKGTRSQIVKQIGNAVPPLLGQLVAEAIVRSD